MFIKRFCEVQGWNWPCSIDILVQLVAYKEIISQYLGLWSRMMKLWVSVHRVQRACLLTASLKEDVHTSRGFSSCVASRNGWSRGSIRHERLRKAYVIALGSGRSGQWITTYSAVRLTHQSFWACGKLPRLKKSQHQKTFEKALKSTKIQTLLKSSLSAYMMQ